MFAVDLTRLWELRCCEALPTRVQVQIMTELLLLRKPLAPRNKSQRLQIGSWRYGVLWQHSRKRVKDDV